MSNKSKSSGRQNPKNTTTTPAASASNNANSPAHRDSDSDRAQGDVAEDIANIFSVLKQISGELQTLVEIRQATSLMEEKLTTLVTRISEVEGKLGFLEESDNQLKANPPATRAEVAALSERLDDLEDRSRQNYLRFVGFPEGCESGDPVKFLEMVLPDMLGTPIGDKERFIERAHRLGPRASKDRRSGWTLIARFMCSGDRERFLRAAQGKGELRWSSKRVMIFPDFSRGTVAKRDAFRECKKILHRRGVKFALQYPATTITTKEGSRRFDNPKAQLSRDIRIRLIQFKVLHRFYWYRNRLARDERNVRLLEMCR
uniref:L1 transposable element RRM domain-containing protein n=1 Tax=Cyprinodon variegatus TaxID=28743 RepID=A0A3Q2CS54_CYPVA